jgi:hypothetical protein
MHRFGVLCFFLCTRTSSCLCQSRPIPSISVSWRFCSVTVMTSQNARNVTSRQQVADRLCNMTDREYGQIGAPTMQKSSRRNNKPNTRRGEDVLSRLRLYQYSTRDGTRETNTKSNKKPGKHTRTLSRTMRTNLFYIYEYFHTCF